MELALLGGLLHRFQSQEALAAGADVVVMAAAVADYAPAAAYDDGPGYVSYDYGWYGGGYRGGSSGSSRPVIFWVGFGQR